MQAPQWATAQQPTTDTLNEAPRMQIPVAHSALNAVSGPDKALSDPWNRTAIVADYTQNYLGSAVSNAQLGWTGSLSACIPGNISQLAQDRTLQRINYYRRLVGLPDNMTFDPSRNIDTQAAALMMGANNSLDHSPPPSWLCYTTQGANGADNSNLGLGSHSSQAVTQFMNDNGSGNNAVGHRRWILYSRAGSFGHGSAQAGGFFGYADVLWVFNPFVTPAYLPNYIAFPPAGYVPRIIIPSRWSFSLPGADFSGASVTVQNQQGTALSITLHPVENGYGDNTVAWRFNTAADLTWSGSDDKPFQVTVSGVNRNGVTQPPYSYTVVAIDPDAIPPCTVMVTNQQGNWSNPAIWSCGRVPTATDRVQVRHLVTVPAGTTARALGIVYQSGGRVLLQTGAFLRVNP